MGQQHEIDLPHVEAEIERPLVLLARFGAALEHAAIDQETDIARFNQGTGTGDFTGRPKKGKTHVCIPPDLVVA